MYKTIFITIFLFLLATIAHAGEKKVTPYGDYCKECSTYGTCKDVLSPKEALNSLNKYYKKRGYKVGKVHHKGRFIEADIHKNNKQVDKVLFDRKTGRLRSIY